LLNGGTPVQTIEAQ